MAYLGLDLATKTGFALWSPGAERPRLGTLRLSRRDPDELAPDFEKLRQHLADLHRIEPLSCVWYEAPIMTGVDKLRTLQLLLGLANMTEWFCYKLGIPCRQVLMSDWRKHFIGYSTGGRDALKKAAIEACTLRGWNPSSDDEADSAGVLDFGLHTIGVKTPWRDAYLFNGCVGRVTA